jgi:hypothetical protein
MFQTFGNEVKAFIGGRRSPCGAICGAQIQAAGVLGQLF